MESYPYFCRRGSISFNLLNCVRFTNLTVHYLVSVKDVSLLTVTKVVLIATGLVCPSWGVSVPELY